MGVIHKLKEDVTAFIINQKKNYPSLGVRQLAAVTSEKFQIKVSKSSVSTTLKNASLSSVVGRRPASAVRGEKFTIPENRKTEILWNMQKAGFAKEKAIKENKKESAVEETATPVEENGKEPLLPLLPDPLAQEQQAASTAKNKEEPVIIDAGEDKDFFARVEQLREQKKNKERAPLNGMGFIFLKAAQWEISGKPVMSELFKRHVPGPSQGNFNTACEMFLFLKFLGAERFEQLSTYRGHGLWQLNNLQGKNSDENETLIKLKELFQWSSNFTGASAASMVMEYNLEKKHIFTEVSGFELTLEDGARLVMDAGLSSFGLGNETPINKSMTWLSNYLISNIHSPVFLTAPGERKLDQVFYDMVAVFENLPGKKIQKASVLGPGGQEIAGFSTIPAQRRTFLIGLAPQQKEFTEVTKNVKWTEKKPFYHPGPDRVVYYGEAKTDILSARFREKVDDLRVIAVWQNKEKGPFWAILTNQNKGSDQDILKAYMSRWPYFGEMENTSTKVSRPYNEGKADNTTQKYGELEFQGIFSDYVHMLNHYCQKYFFQPNYSEITITTMIKTIYELPGNFYVEKDRITVRLEVPPASSHLKDIEYALRRVNERHIVDHFGRKLWLEI